MQGSEPDLRYDCVKLCLETPAKLCKKYSKTFTMLYCLIYRKNPQRSLTIYSYSEILDTIYTVMGNFSGVWGCRKPSDEAMTSPEGIQMKTYYLLPCWICQGLPICLSSLWGLVWGWKKVSKREATPICTFIIPNHWEETDFFFFVSEFKYHISMLRPQYFGSMYITLSWCKPYNWLLYFEWWTYSGQLMGIRSQKVSSDCWKTY